MEKWKKITLAFLSVVGLLFGYTQCVIEAPKNATAKKINTSTNLSVSNPTSNTSNTSPTPTPTPGTTPGVTQLTGNQLFDQQVKPLFESNCFACHAPPVNQPILPGPLTIYTYSEMLQKLKLGTTRDSNSLMNKIRNITSHSGGNRCPQGLTDVVCDAVAKWWDFENGGTTTTPPTNTTLPTGAVTSITNMGKVTGWAADPEDLNSAVVVQFYVDGPPGTGTRIGGITANQSGFNGGYAGNHAFQYFIPVAYRDGVTRQLYATVTDTTGDIALTGTPMTFTAYASQVNGFNYYTNTLKPILTNRCASCHTIGYDQHFASLLSPSKAAGGTQTNNEMINMPSGSHMGKNHPGGNICGNKNNSPCSEIQTWWTLEFN